MESFQTVLDQITTKEIAELTPFDIAFLRARAFYLTPYQAEKYAPVLNGPLSTPKSVEEAVQPVTEATPTASMNYHELKAKAKELGLKSTKVSRAKLEEYIAEHS